MEQIAVLGTVIMLSLWVSVVGLLRFRRAHRRQDALSAAFLRARRARGNDEGRATSLYDAET